MKKIILALVVAAIMLYTYGCNNTAVKNDNVQSGAKEETTSTNVELKGKYMFIRLKTNPTTGFDYTWEIAEGSKGGINLEDTVEESNAKPGMVGTPLYRTYVFSAENCEKGNVTIDFNYKRNWKGGDNAYHVFYDIEVANDETIIFKGKRAQKVDIDVDINEFDDPTFAEIYDINDQQYEAEPEG